MTFQEQVPYPFFFTTNATYDLGKYDISLLLGKTLKEVRMLFIINRRRDDSRGYDPILLSFTRILFVGIKGFLAFSLLLLVNLLEKGEW